MNVFIRKRRDKYYVCLDYTGEDGTRKQKNLSEGFIRKADANKLLIQEKNKLYSNNFIMPDKLTLESYINNWLFNKENSLSITTYNRYGLIVKEVNKNLGKIELQKVTPMLVENFYTTLKRLSNKTKLQYHRMLSKAFKDAYRLQYINKNIMELVEAPKPEKHEADVLDLNEAMELLEISKGSRYEIPINLAIGLGLRASEVCGLKWDKVDFDNNLIKIDEVAVYDEVNKKVVFKEPKSKTSRRVLTVPAGLMEILKVHKEEQDNNIGELNIEKLVFTKENGEPSASAIFCTAYKNWVRRRGLKVVSFHDLRHTNASLMLLNKTDIKTASSRLGHSSIGITMDLYTHVLQSLQNEASDNMDSLLYK